AVIILTALIVAYHWRKGAGTVVMPVALLASYAVWRWRREDCQGHQEMLLSMAFTATERERMAVLINNLCFYASQLVIHSSAEISQRALLNLDKIKNEYEPLLKRLDEV